MLQDLQYPEEQQGVWEYRSETGHVWTLIIADKVGVAMTENTTAWWRTGGARWEAGREMPDKSRRAMCISLPRQGMVRGAHVVTAYQYISHDRHKRQRLLLHDEIVRLSYRGPGTCQRIIGADWNAEVGRTNIYILIQKSSAEVSK